MLVLVAGNGVYLAEGNHVISDDAEGEEGIKNP